MDHSRDFGRQQVCPAHGDFVSKPLFGRIWSRCPSCQDDARKQSEAEEARKAQEARAARVRAAVREAGIPIRFSDASFSGFTADTEGKQRVLKAVQDYARVFDEHLVSGKGLVFMGGVGTGKTYLACALLRACAPRPVLYVSVSDLIKRLRDTWRRDAEYSERSVLTSLAEADLLVVDEVGVQHGTDAARMHLFEVIDARYRTKKPTIMATNCPAAEFTEYLGERVTDRLRETCRVLTFDWASARQSKRP